MKSYFQAGYKLCQQISKALQRRSEAIRNAISCYNTQVAALNPPHPLVSWKDIAEYSFLGEFDLLHHSCADIRDNDWAKPAFHQATVKFFKLQCACEELVHARVEVHRLQSSIHDEEAHISKIVDGLLISDSPLASELKRQHRSWHAINQLHLHHIDQIACHLQYVGNQGVGIRLRTLETPEEASVEEGQNNHADMDIVEQVESWPTGKSQHIAEHWLTIADFTWRWPTQKWTPSYRCIRIYWHGSAGWGGREHIDGGDGRSLLDIWLTHVYYVRSNSCIHITSRWGPLQCLHLLMILPALDSLQPQANTSLTTTPIYAIIHGPYQADCSHYYWWCIVFL